MTSTPWINSERTDRTYVPVNKQPFDFLRIINEYQKYPCPHCSEPIYCKYTRIYLIKDNQLQDPIGHLHHDKNIDKLKSLPVQYLDENDTAGLREINKNNKWLLVHDEQIFANSMEKQT